jgi:hypothetical protein
MMSKWGRLHLLTKRWIVPLDSAFRHSDTTSSAVKNKAVYPYFIIYDTIL